MMEKILIVVDMQNDFIDGELGSKEAKAIVPRVKDKILEYQKNGDTIIFTRDTHQEDYLETSEGKKLPIKHCIKGTHGWNIGLEIIPSNYKIIDKYTFGNRFWDDDLRNYICGHYPNVEIELCGLDSDICVVTNALIIKTLYPEAEVTVDASCCAGSTLERHKAAMEVMKSCQINVIGEL